MDIVISTDLSDIKNINIKTSLYEYNLNFTNIGKITDITIN